MVVGKCVDYRLLLLLFCNYNNSILDKALKNGGFKAYNANTRVTHLKKKKKKKGRLLSKARDKSRTQKKWIILHHELYFPREEYFI